MFMLTLEVILSPKSLSISIVIANKSLLEYATIFTVVLFMEANQMLEWLQIVRFLIADASN